MKRLWDLRRKRLIVFDEKVQEVEKEDVEIEEVSVKVVRVDDG